jgi:hypothetical protein
MSAFFCYDFISDFSISLPSRSIQMPPKRKYFTSPETVYVVLQRSSESRPHRRDEHDVSCVSIHTTLAAANQAARIFFDIDGDDDVEKEDGWSSWEDLDGIRVQTDAKGKVRIISTFSTQEESLVWVEKKTIQRDSENAAESDDIDVPMGSNKRIKVISFV